MLILSDGVIGQMMEKVELPPQKPRMTDEEIRLSTPLGFYWSAMRPSCNRNFSRASVTNYGANQYDFQKKYAEIEEKEVRYEEIMTDDAEYIIVAFGSPYRSEGRGAL